MNDLVQYPYGFNVKHSSEFNPVYGSLYMDAMW